MRFFFILLIHSVAMLSRSANSLMRSSGFVVSTRNSVSRFMSTSTDPVTNTVDYAVMKEKLNNLISSTSRGANSNNKQEILEMVESFEAAKSTKTNFPLQDLLGDWELLYTDDDITR